MLNRIATAIEGRAVQIGTMLAREKSKILPEAIAAARRAGQVFRFYAGEALRMVASVRARAWMLR